MRINRKLIKAILDQLDKEYPSRIDNQGLLVEQHENRDEIIDHLFFLRGRRFVEFKDLSLPEEKICCSIRIVIPEGRTLLKSLS